MALHELATNAVKHGALGAAAGRVAVAWSVEEAAGRLVLRWEEAGGPALEGPPSREGFGMRVIRATVQGQLGGTLEQSWTERGLVCAVALPLDRARGLRRRQAPRNG